MDNEMLKAIIIELRGDSDRSFQEISEILKSKYEVNRSRQAVCGMYNRAISDESINKNTDKIIAKNDILHYHVLGADVHRIYAIMKSDGMNITLKSIQEIIKENGYKIQMIRDTMEDKIIKLMKKGFTLEEIKVSLAYKVESPTNKVMDKLIHNCALYIMKEKKIEVLNNIMEFTQDANLIRSIIQSENESKIQFKDVSKSVDTD